jgi:hypothetical protein
MDGDTADDVEKLEIERKEDEDVKEAEELEPTTDEVEANEAVPAGTEDTLREAQELTMAKVRDTEENKEPEHDTEGKTDSDPPVNTEDAAALPVSAAPPSVESVEPVHTPVVSKENQKPQVNVDVFLILRPMCGSWAMGEDWRVQRPFASTFLDLLQFIEDEKGISRHRIFLRFKGVVLPENKMKWTLIRMGLYDDVVLQVEPTLAGCWWWYSVEEYTMALIGQIERLLDAQPDGGMYLHDMERVISVPPPLKKSLRTFLRVYCEKFHIYCYTPDNTFWVRRTQGLIDLPIFSNVPHNMGYFKHFQAKEFDWEAYRDIDDKYKVEVFETVEEQAARLEREAEGSKASKGTKGKGKGKKEKREKKREGEGGEADEGDGEGEEGEGLSGSDEEDEGNDEEEEEEDDGEAESDLDGDDDEEGDEEGETSDGQEDGDAGEGAGEESQVTDGTEDP